MKTPAGRTTIPSRESSEQAPRATALAIRWSFPQAEDGLLLLRSNRILLGRDESCDFRLEGREVSRQHAEICRASNTYVLRDLRSRNGLYVDGVRVEEASVEVGQVIRLGEWVGVVVEAAVNIPEPRPAFGTLAPKLAGGPVLRPILDRAKLVAGSTLPAVIVGETGTGKEGVSRAIHEWSGRTGPFVAVNCATLVPSLAEAELFGHRKGAFTGADRATQGFFRAANHGTLLLDEIADIPEAVQAKLLRVLQEGEVCPLGEPNPVPIDVRVLAATQIPLPQLVTEGLFRADLCARLDGLTIRLPPLRERKQEIPFLFMHLLEMHSDGQHPDVEPRLIEQLCLYNWPFNLRELDMLVGQLLTLHGRETLLRRSLLPEQFLVGARRGDDLPRTSATATPVDLPSGAPSQAPNTPEYHHARREREMAAFSEALRLHRGSVSRAAAAAGISRQRAYRLMEAFAAKSGKSGNGGHSP